MSNSTPRRPSWLQPGLRELNAELRLADAAGARRPRPACPESGRRPRAGRARARRSPAGPQGSSPQAGRNPLLHVGLDHAECRFVPLERQVQGLQQPLGRVEVGDDPLRGMHRFGRCARLLGVRPKSMINSSGVPVTRQKLAYEAKAFVSSTATCCGCGCCGRARWASAAAGG